MDTGTTHSNPKDTDTENIEFRSRYFHDKPTAFILRIVELLLMLVFSGVIWSCRSGVEKRFSVAVGSLGIISIVALLVCHYFLVNDKSDEDILRKVDGFISFVWIFFFFVASILMCVYAGKLSHKHHEYDKGAAGASFGFFTMGAFLFDGFYLFYTWRSSEN